MRRSASTAGFSGSLSCATSEAQRLNTSRSGSGTCASALRAAHRVTPRADGPRQVELVLEVDDLEAARARVLDSGWALDEDLTARPWGLTDFRLLDPSGYYWRVTEPAGGGTDSARAGRREALS